MDKTLKTFKPGQVALVTAGASGIGAHIAKTLQDHGCSVHICDVDGSQLAACLAEHTGMTGSVADVADRRQLDEMFEEIELRYGRLDILVNNAGVSGPTAAVDAIDEEDWNRTIEIDLNGSFYVTRRAVPLMRRGGGGSIINMASNAGLFGCPLRSPYTAAKWAMVGLTKTWAMELGVDGIRVNALCPGSVSGERIDRVIDNDARTRGLEPQQLRDLYARQSSMRVFVEPQDVANLALFLASDLGATISGQAIGVDGHTEGLGNWLD